MTSHSSGSDYYRDLFEYGLDPRTRRVFLQTEVTGSDDGGGLTTSERVIRALLSLDRVTSPIQLWINTPGGSVYDALAIHDVIRSMDSPVITVGHGQICSAGTLLLACGTGTRYVTEHALFMHHEGGAPIPKEPFALQKTLVALRDKELNQWCALLGSYSAPTSPRRTAKWWRETMKTKPEFYLDSRGMISHGVADAIWGKG